ncbi:MAG: response regulator transcription factor [Planctomycetota bacterium]
MASPSVRRGTGAVLKKRILVIEDDEAVRIGVCDALAHEGYAVTFAEDGDQGLERALHSEWDLLLLDVMLPGCDGISILEQVREVHTALPVILLTALGDESSRVQGLKRGADDYVVKPFSLMELLARVEAVLRRSPERPQTVKEWSLEGRTVYFDRFEVCFEDGTREELSPREVDVLRYLAENPGRAVSRDELLTRIWRVNPGRVETRTIDMHVARLREKMRDQNKPPSVLLTVHGQGYMLAGQEAAKGAGGTDA